MSKKHTKNTVYVCKGDLDVGGIVKNAKAGDALRPNVVKRLANSPCGDTNWLDALVKSGAISEKQADPEPTTPE